MDSSLDNLNAAVYKTVKGKRWARIAFDQSLATHIKNKLDVSHIIAEILATKDITLSELEHYLDPKLKNYLHDSTTLTDMDKGVAIVIDAIHAKKKIAIFGDYDVDGATSSSLIKKFLLSIDYDATIYIPDRAREGYGPNFAALEKLKNEQNIDLVITVDCGSTSHDVIAKAKDIGLKIIVIDHHICSGNLPAADAIINPNREDDKSGYGYLAAVGVCFLFIVGLCKELTKQNLITTKPSLLSLLDLVALGTVCDVVPLVGLNRAFVKQGIKVIESRANTGIRALLDVTKLHGDISTYHLGFVLGPRINAGGRVGESYLGANLLTSNDYGQALEFASQLDIYNNERKGIEFKVLEEAFEQAKGVDKKSPIMYVYGDNWHQGVIGIVASRLKEKFDKPVAIVTFNEDGIGKASCRSITGINFGDAVTSAKECGIITEGGGHAMAAGFSVLRDNNEKLREFLASKFKNDYELISANAVSQHYGYLSAGSINVALIESIEKIGPFGSGNAQPKFILSNISVINAKVLKGEHISCLLTEFGKPPSNNTLKAIAFGALQNPIGEILLSQKYNLNLVITLGLNKWQGNIRPEITIHDAIYEK